MKPQYDVHASVPCIAVKLNLVVNRTSWLDPVLHMAKQSVDRQDFGARLHTRVLQKMEQGSGTTCGISLIVKVKNSDPTYDFQTFIYILAML